MQGAKNIVVGFILMATGGAILVTVELGDNVAIYGVWGLIGVGVIVFAGGMYQNFGPQSAGADAEEIYKSDTITRLVMQSTIATALADGPLDDEEVEMIATACESVMQEELDRDSVRRLATLVEEKGDDILHEIHSEGRLINVDARKAIIDACMLVLKADDKVDVRQTAAVTAIARQLDFSEDETQAMIVEALKDTEQG